MTLNRSEGGRERGGGEGLTWKIYWEILEEIPYDDVEVNILANFVVPVY